MQHRDGELKALLHAERQAVGTRIDDGLQIVALEQLLNSRADLLFRQMIEFGMQQEILRDRQFAVERKGLRHVSDVAPGLHVVRAHRLAEQLARAAARRQEAHQHFHGRRFPAPVRAEEAEDLAAGNPEADVVDRDEIAELAREPLGLDRRRLVRRGDARTHDHFLVQGALGLGHHGDEGVVEIGLARFREQLLQRAGGDDLAVVHRHQPVEALRFVHIGGGDNDAHLRPARADRVDEIPELAARQGIDAGGRLVEDEKVRVVDEGAAEAQLLLHAAGQLARGTRFELLQARRRKKLVDLGATLRRRQSEQSAEEIDVLEHGERRVEVAAEALRHIGDAAADVPQGLLVGDALVEDDDLAALNDLHPRDEPQQRGLANAIRPDHADHDARGNVDGDVSERDRRAIAVRYVLDPSDGLAGHFASGVLVSAALLSGVLAPGAVPSAAGVAAPCPPAAWAA